jgi:hypothetical protein
MVTIVFMRCLASLDMTEQLEKNGGGRKRGSFASALPTPLSQKSVFPVISSVARNLNRSRRPYGGILDFSLRSK